MTKERLEVIKEATTEYAVEADKILLGDYDNYDGADGARYVKDFCSLIHELITDLESLCHHMAVQQTTNQRDEP